MTSDFPKIPFGHLRGNLIDGNEDCKSLSHKVMGLEENPNGPVNCDSINSETSPGDCFPQLWLSSVRESPGLHLTKEMPIE
ncbi:hypothetical protein TNCV_114991 [Trichonephila clavipes]|nr:hypothetical protein TNCV_114991 [Trichonephila clavipes]